MAVTVPVVALLEPASLDSVNGLHWIFLLMDEKYRELVQRDREFARSAWI